MEHHSTDPGCHEHHEINGVLNQIAQIKDLDTLRPLLGGLQELLIRHFRTEEADDGLFDAIGTRAPRLAINVQECLQEHQELLAALEELTARARIGLGETMMDIQGAAESFAQKLRDHEAKETELLNDSMCLDLGGGD